MLLYFKHSNGLFQFNWWVNADEHCIITLWAETMFSTLERQGGLQRSKPGTSDAGMLASSGRGPRRQEGTPQAFNSNMVGFQSRNTHIYWIFVPAQCSL